MSVSSLCSCRVPRKRQEDRVMKGGSRREPPQTRPRDVAHAVRPRAPGPPATPARAARHARSEALPQVRILAARSAGLVHGGVAGSNGPESSTRSSLIDTSREAPPWALFRVHRGERPRLREGSGCGHVEPFRRTRVQGVKRCADSLGATDAARRRAWSTGSPSRRGHRRARSPHAPPRASAIARSTPSLEAPSAPALPSGAAAPTLPARARAPSAPRSRPSAGHPRLAR